MEFLFTFSVSSGTASTLSLLPSLQILTAYSTKLREYLVKKKSVA